MDITLTSALSVIGGFAAKSLWDLFASRRKERDRIITGKNIEFLERQLSEFYWPLYIRFKKDRAIWRRILDVNKEESSLEYKIATAIEKNFVLPNHKDMIQLIETRIHLAQPDECLLNLLMHYVEQATLYQAIREAGETKIFTIGESTSEHWMHQDLFDELQRRTNELQSHYNKLVGISSTTSLHTSLQRNP